MPVTLDKPTSKDAPLLQAVSPTEPKRTYTVADWDTWENPIGPKFELRNGEFFEVAGAAFEHNVIASNMLFAFRLALNGTNCLILGSDQRILPITQMAFIPM